MYANSVELTLFPRPAFVLHHLTVAEWPEYGAEPVITAETVTASLRASTLWHRRVEIASLHFDAPSVNLARDSKGQWNFETLISNSPVLRLSGSSTTAASSSTSPPPFPYVEATEARINFKRGAEKLPFSLEGAQLALWKESGNEWHVRIKARPVRTDLSPGDTGQILGEASVKTTGVLMDSPIRASLEWRRGQLGEISRLLQGEDSGWRGAVDWTANVRGTLAKAHVTSDVQVEEFRRAEFIPPSEIDLSAHCTGEYVHADRRMDQLDCDAPLGGGHLLVKSVADDSNSAANPSGSVASEPVKSSSAGFFSVALQQVSAGFFLDLLRHVHPGIAADTTASGEVNGSAECEWLGLDSLHSCTGELRTTPLTLHLPHVEHALHLSPLVISTPAAGVAQPNPGSREDICDDRVIEPVPSRLRSKRQEPGIWLPCTLRWDGASSATLAGMLTSSGLALHIDGPVDLRDLSQAGTRDEFARPLRRNPFHPRDCANGGDPAIELAAAIQSGCLGGAVPGNATNLSHAASFVVCSVAMEWHGSNSQCDRATQLVPGHNPNCRRSGESDRHRCGMEWVDGNVRAHSFRRKHSMGNILSDFAATVRAHIYVAYGEFECRSAAGCFAPHYRRCRIAGATESVGCGRSGTARDYRDLQGRYAFGREAVIEKCFVATPSSGASSGPGCDLRQRVRRNVVRASR